MIAKLHQRMIAHELRRQREWATDKARLDTLYAARIARIEASHRS